MKHFTIVLETFDGHHYGLLPLTVTAHSVEQAKLDAIKLAEDDGWQRVKVQLTLGGE